MGPAAGLRTDLAGLDDRVTRCDAGTGAKSTGLQEPAPSRVQLGLGVSRPRAGLRRRQRLRR